MHQYRNYWHSVVWVQMTREHASTIQGLQAQISSLREAAFIDQGQHDDQVDGLMRDLDRLERLHVD